tara:strand:- start:6229 stop:6597 length:369 start_codon:yes stop_codon:yes gene_type:complete
MNWNTRNRITDSDDSTLTEAGKANKEQQKKKEKVDVSNETKDVKNVQEDMVNHPPHYKVGGIETLDFIRAKLGTDGYVGYCVGNVLKYLSRAGHKDRQKVQEDLKKAEFYLKEAILIGEKNE